MATKRIEIGLVAGLAAALSLLLACLPAHAERRLALLVGNDAYQNVPQLRTAVNDARALGDTLRRLGFTVTVAENQSRRGLSESLLAFDRQIAPGDTALFFFAGHGFEIRGENFLLPTDVPPAREGEEELVRDASFAADRIIDRLQARGARTTIVVLDACRNNPFDRLGVRAVGGRGGLAAMTPTEGVFIIFSAGAKQTALDGLGKSDPNPNSVFTRSFVRELAAPGLTLVQIAKRTQSDVKQMAASIRHDQTPAYYDQVVGDIVLGGAVADKPELTPATASAPQVALAPASPVTIRPDQLKPPSAEPVNAPLASFTRHNTGWSVAFSLVEPATAISWRLGETGPFKETGFLDTLDSRTRRRMPNPGVELDADTPPSTIYIRYIDQRGDTAGPFPIHFDPAAELARGHRKILELTSTGWLSFREYNGLLVYYTHLVSYRCAIREVRIGIDTTVPDRPVALPPCNPRNPMEVPANAPVFLKLPPTTRSVSIELTYRDGSPSEVKTFRR
jgi:caspase domain-containing protein